MRACERDDPELVVEQHHNLVTKRARAEASATVDESTETSVSKVAMKYPAVWTGEHARGGALIGVRR